ncbi:MAG: 5'-methylthioadenosine/S-adenosylhomocysteine nucleosidase [Gammaproteobacteria bacterium]|nr:5'-methylthioadenosine/S-adenosylhomocysteine nucleosidase [Gammaproteobacteria bacterium]
MLFVGIAGGLDKEEQNFGDIVVSDSIWYYESAKIKANNFPDVRPRVIQATPLLLDRAQNFSDPSWVQNIPNYQNRKLPERLPKIFYSPIASGEKVIAETGFAKALKNMHAKMAATEMESGGVASAALKAGKQTGFMAIRSISDFADANKNDEWQDYAAHCAAAWTFAFLRSGPIPCVSRKSAEEEEKPKKLKQNMQEIIEEIKRIEEHYIYACYDEAYLALYQLCNKNRSCATFRSYAAGILSRHNDLNKAIINGSLKLRRQEIKKDEIRNAYDLLIKQIRKQFEHYQPAAYEEQAMLMKKNRDTLRITLHQIADDLKECKHEGKSTILREIFAQLEQVIDYFGNLVNNFKALQYYE